MKLAGASFRNHLADCMRTLGYQPCLADRDLWMLARPEDGFKYYAYVLLYVDDVLSISHDAEVALHEVDKYFKMKPGSIKDPDLYLGAKLRRVRLPNGVVAWAICPSKYVQEAVQGVKDYLHTKFDGKKLKKRTSTPFERDY